MRDALNTVCAGQAQVFVSSADIAKGDRGISVIEAELSKTDYGIVILSAANHERPWINYEGGALANTLGTAVATVLLDIDTSDITGPLGLFQATHFSDESDMRRLFTEIAQAASPSMPVDSVDGLFTMTWSKLQSSWTPSVGLEKEPIRPAPEMLAEIVNRVRNIETQLVAADSLSSIRSELLQGITTDSLARSPKSLDWHQDLASLINEAVRTASKGRIKLISGGNDGNVYRVRLSLLPDARMSDKDAVSKALFTIAPTLKWKFEYI